MNGALQLLWGKERANRMRGRRRRRRRKKEEGNKRGRKNEPEKNLAFFTHKIKLTPIGA